MQPLDLVAYYQGQLVRQYLTKPKALATVAANITPFLMPQITVQTVTLSAAPTAGTFTLAWGGNTTAAINWNDATATIQTKLQALSGLSAATVVGTLAGLVLTVTFTGVSPVAPLLTATSSLTVTGTAVTIAVAETDDSLPVAVKNGFTLTTAVGAQLDILGKYVGVTRSLGGVTLSDSDFRTLIQLAIILNTSDGSLATIDTLLNQFFGSAIAAYDYGNMQMSYLVSTSLGSQTLVEAFIREGFLPKPTGVTLASVIYSPTITTFFGFRTYSAAAVNNTGYNTYASYSTSRPWLTYAYAVTP